MKKALLAAALSALLIFGSMHHAMAEISRQQAASIAQSQFAGRVIAVTEEQQGDTLLYKVKVLDNRGGMHIVVINANNGQVISAH